MKRLIKLGLFMVMASLLMVGMVGCDSGGDGGGGTTVAPPPTPASPLNGTWAGTLKKTHPSVTNYTFQLIVTQTGGNITCEAVIAYGGTTWTGTFTGTVSSPTGSGVIQMAGQLDNGDTLQFTGTYTQTGMTGNYNNLTAGSKGTFSLGKL